jgi:hypothetical protein
MSCKKIVFSGSKIEIIKQPRLNGFQFFSSYQLFSLPCAICDKRYPTVCLSRHIEMDIHFCPHCRAFICEECVDIIYTYQQARETECKWCNSKVLPTYTKKIPRECTEEKFDQDFGEYTTASSNISEMREWYAAMYRTHQPKFNFPKLFWLNMIDTMGWRFFIEIDFLLKQQHPIQCRLFLSIMKDSTSRMRFLRNQTFQRESIDSMQMFRMMAIEQQFSYPNAQKIVIIHRLSVFAMKRFMCQNSFALTMKYLLSNLGERLFLGLGICSEHSDSDSDSYDIDNPDR